ncbi:transcriptional regulator, MucR family [Methylobacterium sp. 4-46]|uniref:MucR family transcriptional regulator n=1 Tax=unclassified Methylobacterium TaxID=2615210 RepID=UPI000152D1BA|nr:MULTISPECIES: MucR family transcriptional regulator [Methylobacterium]ACA15537.1 transcriptional regulator, MucR family [Methylobacterium sp. 4-46]WFT81256.1 MucR family transcriptional regulator [Methylobacterium nodulans]
MSEAEGSAARNVELVADLVAAFLSYNTVPAGQLPGLIRSVHEAVSGLGKLAEVVPAKPVPPIPIRKTVTPDAIISLEDGKPYKSLKRHLTGRGLTPEQYREKWGLPPNYPMVAPNYAAQRSEFAKALSFGQHRRKGAPPSGSSA